MENVRSYVDGRGEGNGAAIAFNFDKTHIVPGAENYIPQWIITTKLVQVFWMNYNYLITLNLLHARHSGCCCCHQLIDKLVVVENVELIKVMAAAS